jgi:hypothetical protein
MRIIMRNIDAVYLRASKHEYVDQRNHDPTCAATICKADSALPDFGGNLVICSTFSYSRKIFRSASFVTPRQSSSRTGGHHAASPLVSSPLT